MPADNRTRALAGAATYNVGTPVGRAATHCRPLSSSLGGRREPIGFAFRQDAKDLNEYGLLDEFVSFDGDPFWDDLLIEIVRGWNEEDPDGIAI